MKKKQLKLGRKLILDKEWIAQLSQPEGSQVKGGNTNMDCWTSMNTTPCQLCPGPTYRCPTFDANCPANTDPTVGNPCCGIANTGINGPC